MRIRKEIRRNQNTRKLVIKTLLSLYKRLERREELQKWLRIKLSLTNKMIMLLKMAESRRKCSDDPNFNILLAFINMNFNCLIIFHRQKEQCIIIFKPYINYLLLSNFNYLSILEI